MTESWEVVGWVGNACFFSRSLTQWLVSERAGRSVTPVSYWVLSLVGSICLGGYSVHRREYVLLAGIVVNTAIYLWVLAGRSRSEASSPARGPSVLAAVAAIGLLLLVAVRVGSSGGEVDPVWVACAVVGQAAWSSRFVVHWWWSLCDRGQLGRPFWWTSLVGNLALLAYSLHRRDPVFVAGFVLGPFVQIRNLTMLSRERGVWSEPVGRCR